MKVIAHGFCVFAFVVVTMVALGQSPAPAHGRSTSSTATNVQMASPPTAITIQLVQPFTQTKSVWLEALQAYGPYVAAILGFLAAFIVLIQGRMDARYSYASHILQFRIRQVQEFYTPMLVLIEDSRQVYEKLKWTIGREKPGFNLDGFRLLDHMAAFQKEPALDPLIKSILATGEKMCDLITKNAGLIEGGLTQVYVDYIAHFDILRAAAEGQAPAAIQEGWHKFGYYPRMLNREVRQGYKAVLAHLRNYVGAGDSIILKLLKRGDGGFTPDHIRMLEDIAFYDKHAKAYAAKFDSFDLSQIRNRFLGEIVPPGDTNESITGSQTRRILDAGCGTGRDTAAFILQGCIVTAFDASPGMVRECNRKIRNALKQLEERGEKVSADNYQCVEMTFDEMTFRSEFDGAWVAASLVHATPDEMEFALGKLVNALKPNGMMYISLKYGRGQHEFDTRVYSYYRKIDFGKILGRLGGVKIDRLWLTDQAAKEIPHWKQTLCWAFEHFHSDRRYWLNVLVKKEPR